MGEVFCFHSKTGFTGTVKLSNDDIQLHLRSFSEQIDIEDGLDEDVHLETNELCSLIDTFGTTDFLARMIGRHSVIRANIAVVGDRFWRRDESPEQIAFSFDDAKSDFFVHGAKVSAVSVGRRKEPHDLKVFVCDAKNITVELGYLPRFGGGLSEAGVSVAPVLCLIPKERRDIHACLAEIFDIVTFVSAIHGRYIGSRDVRFRNMPNSALQSSLEVFRVFYARTYSTQLSTGAPILSCHDDDRTGAFVSALREWLDRAHEWKVRNWLMIKCLNQRGLLNAERLLTATRWFESFPESQSQPSLPKTLIETLCAHVAGLGSGYSERHFQKRLRGCLSTLRKETRRDVLLRIVGDVESSIGKEWVTEGLVPDIELAYALRGSAAHAELDLHGKSNVKDALRPVCALEYLCLLLTFRNIPLDEHARSRLKSHPLVRAYTALDRERGE